MHLLSLILATKDEEEVKTRT